MIKIGSKVKTPYGMGYARRKLINGMWEVVNPENGVLVKFYNCELDEVQESLFSGKSEVTGWSSEYYQLPPDAKELQDLIEYREMDFATGNVFKACYRVGNKPGVDALYDWNKIKWFAERKISQLEKEQK